MKKDNVNINIKSWRSICKDEKWEAGENDKIGEGKKNGLSWAINYEKTVSA